jgi:hypothetical protein
MLGKNRDKGTTRAVPSGIRHLLTRSVAPPASARNEAATKTPDMRVPLKKEAAKTAELVKAQPDKICQKIGIAALEVRKRVYQYTAAFVRRVRS